MIASAHITISDLNDPIQQGTAPASPVEGMLWLDTSVVPPQLKRWDGTAWGTVNDPAALSIGGRNLLLNSTKNFPQTFQESTMTKARDVAVPEWACTDAMRISGTSGTSPIFATFNAASHGLALYGDNAYLAKVGQEYTYSIYLKNNHATNALRVRMNGIGRGNVTLEPGAVLRWVDTGTGNGTSYIQIHMSTPAAGDEYDMTFWHPMIAYGNKVTDWSPAPEDTNAEILSVMSYAQAVKAQVDGKIDMWFYAVAPSASVPPENGWSAQDKADHVDDLYYNIVTGYCYRYTVSGGTYSWTRIKDSDITSAANAASAAQDTADNKRRVFTAQPTPPYDKGDMWVQGESGDIKVCVTAKASGSYAAGDWALASKYTDDTAVNNLQIGGRNLLLNSATNFPRVYQGATFTKTSNVTVAEWACTDALRIAGTAGTSAIFALFNAASHGLELSGENYWITKAGQSYTYSMYLKNNHATNSVRVRMNNIGTGYYTIAPGAVVRWTDTGVSNGSGEIQIHLATSAAGDAFDVTYWHPMIEYGNQPSDWKPAEGDTTKEINDAAGAVQENLDNLTIGGRNYARAMDGISLTPIAQNCSYAYDSDTGTYELTCTATGGYSQIYVDSYNRIEFPERLIGQKLIFHADEIICTNSALDPKVFLNFRNDANQYVQNHELTPSTLQQVVIPPAGTTWISVGLRLASNQRHAVGDRLTVRGIMLEEGTHRSGWVPADEDVRQEIEMKVQSVSAQINEEGDRIRSEVRANYVLASDMSQLAQTVSTISEQTENNYTWSVNRINQLQTDMDNANSDFASQLQTISTYMKFGEDGLSIGKTGNPFTFRVSNDRLVFYNNNAEVAYLSNNKLYITHAEVLTDLILGRFAFVPQANGNMSLVLN